MSTPMPASGQPGRILFLRLFAVLIVALLAVAALGLAPASAEYGARQLAAEPVTDEPTEGSSVDEAPAEETAPAEPTDEESPVAEAITTPHKVVVCKYVRTPGVGEVLSHVVIVDDSALGDDFAGTFPFAFADAHFNSLALRWAEDGEQAHDVPLTDCPAPPTTTLVIKKVDFEDESLALANATFEVYEDNQPFADAGDPAVGAEDVLIGTEETDTEGLAKFAELQEGHYLVVETIAPEGYELPEADTIAVVIDDGNFVEGGEMAPILFKDLALGQLAIVSKQQFELVDGDWVESDGLAAFGDVVKYVVNVRATGPKLFHHVVVTDYVPGFNPADTTSNVEASLVPESAVCTGSLTCTVSVEDGFVTWEAGTVHDAEGAVEMVVRIPDAPDSPEFDEDGVYTATLWNEGYLGWDEVVGATAKPGRATAARELVHEHHTMTSNDVVLSASMDADGPVDPPDQGDPDSDPDSGPGADLPDTGSPALLGLLAAAGAGLLGLGLALTRYGRRRNSATS